MTSEQTARARIRRSVTAPEPRPPYVRGPENSVSTVRKQVRARAAARKASPFTPTDKKPTHTAPVAHITDPLLKNLLEEGDKADRERAKLALSMMRSSCAYFAAEVLTGPAMYGGKFIVADHHLAWDALVTTQLRLAVLAPRDHGKTYFFDFAYPIWKAVFTPNGKGYIFSATQPQAIRILEDIKEEIESNPKLQWLIPKGANKKQWSSTAITLANGHKIYARGYGTKVRGAHPDWIVVDDGLNDEDAYSEVTRAKNIDYFYTAITNMIIPGGQIVVVGTPFHAADLYASLEKNPRYCFRKFPAISKEGTALWPQRYSAETLSDKKVEIGSIRFTREFLVEPISDDMSIFPERLFRGQPTEVFNVKLGMPARFWNQMGIVSRFVGVDFAISSSTSADYTAVFVMGLDSTGNRWVLDIQQHRGLEYQEQLSLINAIGQKYRPDVIFLEANQMQRIFGDELIRNSDLPIMKFYTTGKGNTKTSNKKLPKGNTVSQNKNSLEGGVPSLRVLLENKKFRIPRGDTRSVEMTDKWISEMKAFTWADGKLQGVGSHDDLVMACWICDQAIRQSGFSFSTGDEDDGKASLDDIIKESMGVDPNARTGDEEPEGWDGTAEIPDKKTPTVDPVLEAIQKFGSFKATTPTPGSATKAGETDDDDLEDADEDFDPLNFGAPGPGFRLPVPGR